MRGLIPADDPAATRARRRGEPASRPHVAAGRRRRTPTPDHQSQSLSRSYGSCLPTSLVHMPSLARGFSPWRPDADMSTTSRARFTPPDFQGPSEARRTHATTGGAIPIAKPYLPSNGFQGTGTVKKKRELFPPPPPASPGLIASPLRLVPVKES